MINRAQYLNRTSLCLTDLRCTKRECALQAYFFFSTMLKYLFHYLVRFMTR
uniref:Uncharacterized protein n=1 Tax=Anguilla anguilla TaxID=7936 RepID=A0A0E9RXC0_ANGAN